MLDLLPILVLFVTGVAAFFDIRKRIIPNWLTIPTFLLVLLIQVFSLPLSDFLLILQTILFSVIFLLGFFCFKVLGGGDVKLLLVIACSVPLPEFFKILFLIVLVGGAQGLGVLFCFFFMQRKNALKTTLPYGVSIFLGYGGYLLLKLDSIFY